MSAAFGTPITTAAWTLAVATVSACATASSAPPPPHTATTILGPQGKLAVDDGGSGGIPILFVHGNGGNRTQWKEELDRARRGRRAVAFDLRGMGESAAAGNADYSVSGFAEDVAAVADSLRLRRFILVGHSYGGAVVAAYAGRHPEQLAGLVFADCAGDLRQTPQEQIERLRRGLAAESYARFTDAWFESILVHSTASTRDAVLRSLHATPREVFTRATLSLYAFAFDDALSRYAGPRLSISSFLFDNPLAVHRTVPAIPVRQIANASHWLMMDRPEEFHRILNEFLDSAR